MCEKLGTDADLRLVSVYVRFSKEMGENQEQKKVRFADRNLAANYSGNGVEPLDSETDPFVESAWQDQENGEYLDYGRTHVIEVLSEPI